MPDKVHRKNKPTTYFLIIKVIFIKFYRTIWEIGGQMSWDRCLAESLHSYDQNLLRFFHYRLKNVLNYKNKNYLNIKECPEEILINLISAAVILHIPSVLCPLLNTRWRRLLYCWRDSNWCFFLICLLQINLLRFFHYRLKNVLNYKKKITIIK
jgi:hypothetical protein